MKQHTRSNARGLIGLLCAIAMLVAGFAVAPTTQVHAADSMPVYRLYNENTGEHFYTPGVGERNGLIYIGWKYEGIGWWGATSGAPVYRMYNPNAKGGDHYYTRDHNEAQHLASLGWHWDNNGAPLFYSAGDINLYVAYNPNAKSGAHNYTTNGSEQNNLLSHGWLFGAVAWKVKGLGEGGSTAVAVDKDVTGIGGAEQRNPGSFRLEYSNKPFDNKNFTGNPTIEFRADMAMSSSASDYETQFIIGGNGNASGQVGLGLHFQAGNDARYAQNKINVTTIDFPENSSDRADQFYSVNTAASGLAKGIYYKLEVKYWGAQGYMQTFVNGRLVGQYKTKLRADGGRYILHCNSNAALYLRNITVKRDGIDVTHKGAPSFSSTSYDLPGGGTVAGAY